MPAFLRFEGVVTKGCGRFAREMVVPGREAIAGRIRDWPVKVTPGTLNVRVTAWPGGFSERLGAHSAKALDTRRFQPEAELGRDEIADNTIRPRRGDPSRGNAQVWRATLRSHATGETVLCWVLRRIGSGLSKDLECVAGLHLREKLALHDGDGVDLVVEGRWE